MGFQKVEFSFPDEEKDDKGGDIDIESSGAIEIDLSGKEKPVKYVSVFSTLAKVTMMNAVQKKPHSANVRNQKATLKLLLMKTTN